MTNFLPATREGRETGEQVAKINKQTDTDNHKKKIKKIVSRKVDKQKGRQRTR